MPWITGLSDFTGPRWSAGAFWGSADEWADADDWPIEYDPDERVSVGIFVGGYEVTAEARSASWGLGQADILPTSISPSSASVTVRSEGGAFDAAGFDPSGFEPVQRDGAISDRLVILTEWDVLWVGTVEDIGLTATVDRVLNDGSRRWEATYSAADDLARASQVDHPPDRYLSGPVLDVAAGLMGQAGLPAIASGVAGSDEPTDAFYRQSQHSGKCLSVLADLMVATLSQASYSPAGLRIAPIELMELPSFPTPVEDYDDFDSLTISRNVSTVRNRMELLSDEPTFDWNRYYDWTDSQKLHGVRAVTYDYSPWGTVLPLTIDSTWITVIDNSYKDPVRLLAASGKVNDYRHVIARLIPFDQIEDSVSGDIWRVLTINHRLTVDSWTVDVQGVELFDYIPPG